MSLILGRSSPMILDADLPSPDQTYHPLKTFTHTHTVIEKVRILSITTL
jgi:hypothetical protein